MFVAPLHNSSYMYACMDWLVNSIIFPKQTMWSISFVWWDGIFVTCGIIIIAN